MQLGDNMSANALVQTRVSSQVKEEAATVLAAMGLTVSDAVRMLLTRIASEKLLPFDPLVPNAATIEAILEARRGRLETFSSFDALLADATA
jgi:DNA-damage-inducible protein J